MKKILVLGSTNMDFVIEVEQMPLVGETLMSKRFSQIPGGKGANQACACARLGGDTVFLSAVGKDGLGEQALAQLIESGADCRNVIRCEEMNTGMAIIYVDQSSNNSIVVVPGANDACNAAYLQSMQPLLEEASVVLAQLEIPADGVYQALQNAHAMGKTTILNPAPAPASIPGTVLECLDYITPNETELDKLTHCGTETMEQIRDGALALLEMGVRNVIVTLGHRGAFLKNRQTEQLFPSLPIRAVDTTAAGDTFNGAIAVRLAEGVPIHEAIPFANAASALAVSRRGAQISVPSREETEKFWKQKGEKG